MAQNIDEILQNIYYDPENEAGYAGASRLVEKTKNRIFKNRVYNWLQSQDTYTLHKPVRRKFQRQPYNVSGIDSVWEADLVDLSSLKEYNDGYTFLLVVIDVLSKFAWVEPLKSKSTTHVAKAFERILEKSNGRVPDLVQSDRGTELVGGPMQSFFKSRKIMHRVTKNPDVKAAVVERFNRTLKERMWRYFTHQNSKRYIDILPALLTAYNNSKHSTIKMAPASVTVFNSYIAKKNMDSKHEIQNKRPKYVVGDLVRISRTKGTFEKGYTPNWSTEIFKIIRVLKHRKPVLYKIEDLAGEVVDGFFYQQELLVIKKDLENETFKISEILDTKGKGSRKKYLVSWLGYPSKFNSWISASELKNI